MASVARCTMGRAGRIVLVASSAVGWVILAGIALLLLPPPPPLSDLIYFCCNLRGHKTTNYTSLAAAGPVVPPTSATLQITDGC